MKQSIKWGERPAVSGRRELYCSAGIILCLRRRSWHAIHHRRYTDRDLDSVCSTCQADQPSSARISSLSQAVIHFQLVAVFTKLKYISLSYGQPTSIRRAVSGRFMSPARPALSADRAPSSGWSVPQVIQGKLGLAALGADTGGEF